MYLALQGSILSEQLADIAIKVGNEVSCFLSFLQWRILTHLKRFFLSVTDNNFRHILNIQKYVTVERMGNLTWQQPVRLSSVSRQTPLFQWNIEISAFIKKLISCEHT